MFKEFVESNESELISGTQNLIRVKSVEEQNDGKYPFGEGPAKALQNILSLGESLGFVWKNIDNYAGYIEMGEGEEMLGILVHVDVVPEGSGWTYPPYEGTLVNGNIYGRGAIDDKGPAIAALYAMKAIKETSIDLKRKVRLIIGTNEETNWEGIKQYLDSEKVPDFAFTPDADFPVIHGEKGVLFMGINRNIDQSSNASLQLISIEGGTATNSVPENCRTVIEVNQNSKELIIKGQIIRELEHYIVRKKMNANIMEKNNQIIITTNGKSAHGSTPEEGINAISHMFELLNQVTLFDDNINELIKWYKKSIGYNYYGEKLGIDYSDEVSGKLTFNVGKILFRNNKLVLEIDIRYPVSVVYNDLLDTLTRKIQSIEGTLKIISHLESIYIPKDHFMVKRLMNIYKKVTGDTDSKPIVIGGATYARAMKNTVAFGPLFPGAKDSAHQKDEFISVSDLKKCCELYAHAIYELAAK